MIRTRSKLVLPAAIALVAGAAFALAGEAEPPPSAVTVVKPVVRPLARDLRIPATLLADEMADIFSKASGYVSSVNVDIGSGLHEGDPMVTIDVPEMADELRRARALRDARRAQVEALRAKAAQAADMIESARAEAGRSEAELALAQITRQRKEELYDGRAISDQERDEARQGLAIAEANLAVARARIAGAEGEKRSADASIKVGEAEVAVVEADLARLKTLMKYARIAAPYDATVIRRHVDPGAFVRSAAEGNTRPLLRIARTDRIRVVLHIPETEAPYVRAGTAVTIDVRALKSGPIEAKISRTARALEPDTRTMRAEVDIDNHDDRLLPGMYAQVAVKVQLSAAAMLIPSEAIHVRGKDLFVFVARKGRVEAVPVSIGYDDGTLAEAVSGLSGEDLVITAATSALEAGVEVEPILDSGS